jgi:hypothetical protein
MLLTERLNGIKSELRMFEAKPRCQLPIHQETLVRIPLYKLK